MEITAEKTRSLGSLRKIQTETRDVTGIIRKESAASGRSFASMATKLMRPTAVAGLLAICTAAESEPYRYGIWQTGGTVSNAVMTFTLGWGNDPNATSYLIASGGSSGSYGSWQQVGLTNKVLISVPLGASFVTNYYKPFSIRSDGTTNDDFFELPHIIPPINAGSPFNLIAITAVANSANIKNMNISIGWEGVWGAGAYSVNWGNFDKQLCKSGACNQQPSRKRGLVHLYHLKPYPDNLLCGNKSHILLR